MSEELTGRDEEREREKKWYFFDHMKGYVVEQRIAINFTPFVEVIYSTLYRDQVGNETAVA